MINTIDYKQNQQPPSHNISFSSRNKEIKEAEKILHLVKSKFPASSPYIADCYISKRGNQKGIGANYSTKKLKALRTVLRKKLSQDSKYCLTLLSLIKKAKVMNCKENSELSYLIASVNGYKNPTCVNLTLKKGKHFYFLDHAILLLNQEIPSNCIRSNKFYLEQSKYLSMIKPRKKAIVVDTQYGFVDYWDNAVLKYKSIFNNISDLKMYISPRDPIIKKQKDIKVLIKTFPELQLNNTHTNKKNGFLQKCKSIFYQLINK